MLKPDGALLSLYHALPLRLRQVVPAGWKSRWRRRLVAAPVETGGPTRGLQSKLWGGFSRTALAELERIRVSFDSEPRDAARAAWILARWAAAQGDHAAALENIILMRLADPATASDPRQYLQEAKYLTLTGRPAEARALLDARTAGGEFDPSAALLRASTFVVAGGDGPDEAAALEEINSIYRHFGLAEIVKRDPARPLSMDNLGAAGLPGVAGPKVTVIVPVYNSAETVGTALLALAGQSWENLEVLVVDDASTDATADVVSDFCARDRRFRLIRQAVNGGSYACRNRALGEATGAYVTVHDADDWSHPEKLRVQAGSMARGETPYNFTGWTRTLPDLVFLGIVQATRSLVSLNFSSHMIGREALIAAGGWDHVRVSGDSELIWRIEALGGRRKEAFRDHHLLRGCPLSFGRLGGGSLTGSEATHVLSIYHGVRREYREAADRWHARLRAGEGLEALATPGVPRFPAPAVLRPERPVEPPLDILFVGDFNQIGGTLKSSLAMIEAGLAAGRRCGLLQYRRYDLDTVRALNRQVRAFAWEKGIRIVAPGEQLRAETVVFTHPPLADNAMDRFPEVDHDRLVVVVNQMAERDLGRTSVAYHPERVRSHLREYFGSEGVWAPISERVRGIMEADPRYPAPHEDTWTPLLDLDKWAFAPRWHGRGRPVLGRHGRDHPLKWPAEPEALSLAYCAGKPCDVRFLGGARYARERIGRGPANWREEAFGSQDVQDFLGELDFFLHYPDRTYIEEFGRAPMEAMALGLPVLLPPEFAPTFGEAAVYAEPEAVWSTIDALWRDEAAYLAQARRGRDFVEANCGYAAFPPRIDRLAACAGVAERVRAAGE